MKECQARHYFHKELQGTQGSSAEFGQTPMNSKEPQGNIRNRRKPPNPRRRPLPMVKVFVQFTRSQCIAFYGAEVVRSIRHEHTPGRIASPLPGVHGGRCTGGRNMPFGRFVLFGSFFAHRPVIEGRADTGGPSHSGRGTDQNNKAGKMELKHLRQCEPSTLRPTVSVVPRPAPTSTVGLRSVEAGIGPSSVPGQHGSQVGHPLCFTSSSTAGVGAPFPTFSAVWVPFPP
jgi:hypothetical protein